jgi:hypothetical protein
MQLMATVNQHSAILLALAAIVSSMPDKSKLDRDLIKKKIHSKGTVTDAFDYADSIKTLAEEHVERLLKA